LFAAKAAAQGDKGDTASLGKTARNCLKQRKKSVKAAGRQ